MSLGGARKALGMGKGSPRCSPPHKLLMAWPVSAAPEQVDRLSVVFPFVSAFTFSTSNRRDHT